MRVAILTRTVVVFTALSGTGHAMTCSIDTVSALAFGTYDVLSGSPLDTTGTISYRCDDVGGTDTIVMRLGRGGSSTYLPRRMTQGSYQLEYNLYLNAARTTIWGDGSEGTSQLGPVTPEEGVVTNVSVFGRIAAGQNAHAGQYSDTVVVTLVF